MNPEHIDEIEQLYKVEDEQIKKLHLIVEDAIKEEALTIEELKHPPQDILSKGEMLSDKVARFGGSWKFIIIFIVVLIIWILYNVTIAKSAVFDPYPFILMNLVLSCIAALQAPVIMMSQNRQEKKDRKHAESDYLVNLKAEIEIRNLHQKINLLMEEQINKLIETQSIEIKLLKEIHTKLDRQKINEKIMIEPYDTMTEALADLYKQGFTYDFNLITKATYDIANLLPIRDFEIIRTIRFENDSDPAENAILYAIVSGTHNIKGTLVNGFGVYADALTNRFINSIHMQRALHSFS